MGEIDRKKGFRDTPASFARALSVELMEFRQKYPQSTLLQCVAGLPRAPTTEEECGQLTEGLSEALQVLRYQISVKNSQSCVPLATCLGYSLEEGRWMVSHNYVSAILQSIPCAATTEKKSQYRNSWRQLDAGSNGWWGLLRCQHQGTQSLEWPETGQSIFKASKKSPADHTSPGSPRHY